MACETVTTGSAGVQAMLNAFQQGGGLCGSNLELWHVAITFISCTVLALWVVIGQYQQWTNDQDNGFQYMATGALGVSFVSLAGILFLG